MCLVLARPSVELRDVYAMAEVSVSGAGSDVNTAVSLTATAMAYLQDEVTLLTLRLQQYD